MKYGIQIWPVKVSHKTDKTGRKWGYETIFVPFNDDLKAMHDFVSKSYHVIRVGKPTMVELMEVNA